ncbi:pyridoxamine 5'-phosphate oxidase-domain-containing protein [Mucor lusitanicus]|uniref:Pyridoxamine 5'-phosphate oxidase-domain-containing protein n=1 Tax=Mucor circinelloides f. lusitanicus TaxID=29924 RepID=A0A8H4BRN4_MUCCL|nr:pyridoxamine 5'-phosphate oxidase-domain-containing protein [Mucor lusitanicus]
MSTAIKPTWKKLLQSSLQENIAKIGTSATYASIATVKKDNTPAVRTVVMRGFVAEHHTEETGWESDLLVVITDKTSDKVEEIRNNPHTEINWYMNGTMEQYRIGGTIAIVERDFDQSKLNHLNSSMTMHQSLHDMDGHKSLALQSFARQQQKQQHLNWQAERLRQFIQFGASMRANMVHSEQVKELEINEIDPISGWYQNNQVQGLLDEAYENFVLLVVKVDSTQIAVSTIPSSSSSEQYEPSVAGFTVSNTKQHSDTSRFPTLERLENSMMLSKNSKITIEPVTFPGEYTSGNNNNNNMTKSNGSQSDVKSIHSTSSNYKKRNQQYRKKKNYQSTPTEIFAKNLSEAVLDVDDSFEDGYVYNTKGGLYPSLSPPIPFESKSNHRSAASSNDEANSYFSDHHKQKFRRPGLRSTVSELPARGVKSVYLDSMSSKFEKQKFRNSHFRCSSSSGEEGDEENAPLLYYSSSSSNTRRRRLYESRSPLQSVEAITFGNVLGTQKQLIFNFHARASNSNAWKIQISHAAISVFAASHFVPTSNTMNETSSNRNTRQEYLATINKLDDPLIFEASPLFYLRSKSSVSTSQIQIKNPGETKGDTSGNERWSLLIRYPYELTLRGVLKYQLFPYISSKTYSARVCKIMQIDPATGSIKEVPLPEQSICDET